MLPPFKNVFDPGTSLTESPALTNITSLGVCSKDLAVTHFHSAILGLLD